jgi:divalent metal cation (Fe/Co/Zn/Cd) transporter
MEAHIDFDENLNLRDLAKTIDRVSRYLKESYHIVLVTLQAEYDKDDDKEFVCINNC